MRRHGSMFLSFPRKKTAVLASLLRSLISAAAVLLVMLCGDVAWSQTRTIKLIVPSAAGGGADILARLLADQMSRAQGLAIVVENRPGAGNIIGTEAASRAAPDGNTLLINTPDFVINPQMRAAGYDPLTSFVPICYLARSPQLLVVNGASPYRTLADLLNAARAKPGELSLASAGPASSPHLAFETLKRAAGVNMIYVPYQGSGPAVNALLGEHVTSVLASYPNVVEQVRTGTLRALATASPTRIPELPDVPTIADSGFKDYESDIWFGVMAPAKTPDETVTQAAGWFTAALQAPEVKSKLGPQGLFAVGTCGTDFGVFIRKQYEDAARAIREGNIKAQ
jgi:tripartite-type tricarboxylate transporter receptor subunit TctC